MNYSNPVLGFTNNNGASQTVGSLGTSTKSITTTLDDLTCNHLYFQGNRYNITISSNKLLISFGTKAKLNFLY